MKNVCIVLFWLLDDLFYLHVINWKTICVTLRYRKCQKYFLILNIPVIVKHSIEMWHVSLPNSRATNTTACLHTCLKNQGHENSFFILSSLFQLQVLSWTRLDLDSDLDSRSLLDSLLFHSGKCSRWPGFRCQCGNHAPASGSVYNKHKKKLHIRPNNTGIITETHKTLLLQMLKILLIQLPLYLTYFLI